MVGKCAITGAKNKYYAFMPTDGTYFNSWIHIYMHVFFVAIYLSLIIIIVLDTKYNLQFTVFYVPFRC